VSFSRRSGSEEIYADGLQTWFARSAPLSIPISFTGLRDGMWFSPNINSRITEEVLKIAPRWRSLRVLQGQAPASFVRRLGQCRLDSLQELELEAIEDPESDPPPIISFSAAPRLRKLCLNLYSDSHQIHWHMPWAQLTDLTLADCHAPDIAIDILAQCANLVRASVGTTGWPVLPQARRDIALNGLHTLSLPFTGSAEHAVSFLYHLSAPALEELCLNFGQMEYGVEKWTDAHFTAFQLRSPNITRLELSYSYLTSNDLRTAIRQAPCLTHLQIAYCDYCFDDALFHALQYKDGIEPLVARLHSLALVDMDEDAFTEDILAGMIASRWWTDAELASCLTPPAVARWTFVQLSMRGKFSPEFEAIAENLRGKGLHIRILASNFLVSI